MQMKQPGFSLIELLIYLMMSTVCAFVICGWASQIITHNVPMRLQQSIDIALLAAIDCCTRDLWAASPDIADWLHTDADWIAWRQGDTVIGYRLNNHILVRTVTSLFRTPKQHTSHIAAAVHAGSFRLHVHKGQVIGVFIDLWLKNNEAERKCRQYVALRNVHL